MEYLTFAGAIALMAVVAQTGAMFYWGGKLQANMDGLNKLVPEHDERIRNLELDAVRLRVKTLDDARIPR